MPVHGPWTMNYGLFSRTTNITEFGSIFALMSNAIISPKANRLAVAGFFFIAGLSFASWASRIPDLKLFLHLSDAALGGVLFALPAGSMVSLPLAGWLVSKYGSKKIVTIAMIGYPLILLIIGFVSTLWQLIGVLFIFGLFGNLSNISINTQAIGVEQLYKRSIMASFHGIWSLAGFTGAALGTMIISFHVSPLLHFILIAGISFLLVFFLQRYALEKDTRHSNQPIFAKPDGFLLRLGLIAFSCMVCEGTMFDWSGVYFQKIVAVPNELTTLGYAAFMGTMAGGRFVGDKMVMRFGPKSVLQGSGIVITIGLLLAVIFPYIIPATFGFLLVGFGVSSVIPLVYSAAGKSKTLSPGLALAAVSTIGFFGFLLGPPIIGFIAQATNLRWSFSLIAVIGFGTTVLATFMKWDK